MSKGSRKFNFGELFRDGSWVRLGRNLHVKSDGNGPNVICRVEYLRSRPVEFGISVEDGVVLGLFFQGLSSYVDECQERGLDVCRPVRPNVNRG